jgi:hypothetical protein
VASLLDNLLLAPWWRHGDPDGPPRAPGAYAWFSDTIPDSVPPDGLHDRDGHHLLYVGIAPRATATGGRDPMRTSLAPRIAYHYDGRADASALRMSLGVVLDESLGLSLQQLPNGERFDWGAGEAILSSWMHGHLRVSWLQHVRPWEVSDMAFRNLALPLNLQAQDPSPFQRDLTDRQTILKDRARADADHG